MLVRLVLVAITGMLLTACSDAGPGLISGGTAPAPGPAPVTDAPGASSAAPLPVLGAGREHSTGLGTARPATIDLGGADSSGIIEHLTWQSWGGATASGYGTAGYAAPGAPLASASPQQATVLASDLGTCAGRPAYRHMSLYFPQHGEAPGAHPPIDVCEP